MRLKALPRRSISSDPQVVATLLSLLMVVLAIGCSEPTDPSRVPFAIVSISEDSLLAEDQFVITADKDITRDSVKLFIGTLPCPIDSVVGKNIYARAVAGDGSYRLRLYANDLEASGNFFIYLFNRSLSDWGKSIVGFEPFEGNVGDTIEFWIDSTSLDVTTLNPGLNGIPLSFLKMKGKKALYTIPDAAQDGPMQLRIFGRDVELYPFDVIRPETDLPFEEGTLRVLEISVGVDAHVVRLNPNGTTEQFDIYPVQGNCSFGLLKLQVSDSIRLDHASDTTNSARYCTIRAYLDPVTRLISGHISYYRREPEVEGSQTYESMEIKFTDLAWYKERGTYHLYADSGAMSHVSILKLKHGHIDDEYWVTGTYETPLYSPDFVLIEWTP
jgi:hypothetical protein